MTFEIALAFIAACVVLALVPGPNMALFLANTASYGTRAGLMTVAGNAVGLAILAAAAALGMTSLMTFMAEWFDVVRWVGALYLLWLGSSRLWQLWRGDIGGLEAATPQGGRWFWQAMLVSLSNPKVLLFLGAFLPQFVSPASPALPQLVALAVLFVITLAVVDSTLVVLAGRARRLLAAPARRLLEGATGIMLLVGGLLLATARRP